MEREEKEQGFKKYQNDPVYRTLVDHFCHVLLDGQLNIVDLKSALNFAINKFVLELRGQSHLISEIADHENF